MMIKCMMNKDMSDPALHTFSFGFLKIFNK